MMKLSDFNDKFVAFCKENGLIHRGDKIILGISGGADSTALLFALVELRSRMDLKLLAAHVNYHLRGEDSDRDEEYVKKICFEKNVPIVIKKSKLKTKSNLENKARELRFDYFNTLLAQYKFDKIALGHNREDQAETMIYRFFRGAGITGLKGILPKTINLIHPLICFSRRDITAYLESIGRAWREDKSNQEYTFVRNRIRNELLPWLKDNLNPKIVNKLSGAASMFAEAEEILHDIAIRRLSKTRNSQSDDTINLSVYNLKKIKPVIRFYLYREVYKTLNNGSMKDFYHNHFEEIEALLSTEGSKEFHLPHGISVFKLYESLIFSTIDPFERKDDELSREVQNIRSRISFGDYRIGMKKLKKLPSKRKLYEDESTAYIDYDKVTFPITMRYRQAGDRFHPLGMEHSKSLKDFFIDEKVPKFERDNILIFTDAQKIIWVGGLRIDNRVAIGKATKTILMLRIEKISASKTRAAERIKKRDNDE